MFEKKGGNKNQVENYAVQETSWNPQKTEWIAIHQISEKCWEAEVLWKKMHRGKQYETDVEKIVVIFSNESFCPLAVQTFYKEEERNCASEW